MDRYEWCGVEPGNEVKNVSGRNFCKISLQENAKEKKNEVL